MELETTNQMPEENKKNKKKLSKKKKIILIILITIFLIGIITAIYFLFFNKEPVKEKVQTKIEKEEVEVKKKLAIVDENSNKRPIAVMIDNNIGRGLHAGLQESYINYEIIVEGGLTRIMAIFKDKDVSLIGPVRSSRHYFLDYALESDSIYAHYGWSPYAEKDIRTLGVNNINGLYDSAYWRDTTIAAPHNVFTSTTKLYDYANKKNYDITSENWQLLNYSTDEINLGPPEEKKKKESTETESEDTTQTTEENVNYTIANTITIPYSYYQTRGYIYEPTAKTYLRSMNGVAHIDKVTQKQLNYKNIIIKKVNNKTLDSYGRQDLDTVGTGTGYYITNGYAKEINWTKSTRNGKTKYTYSDGTEIKINDGNTFIHVIPITSNVDIR